MAGDEHRDVGVWPALLRGEEAPGNRLDAHEPEEVVRDEKDEGAVHRLLAAGDARQREVDRRDIAEGFLCLGDRPELSEGELPVVAVRFPARREHRHDLGRLVRDHRAQNQAVDEREHGRVHADGEGQRHDGHGHEPGRLSQHAERKAEVRQESSHGCMSWLANTCSYGTTPDWFRPVSRCSYEGTLRRSSRWKKSPNFSGNGPPGRIRTRSQLRSGMAREPGSHRAAGRYNPLASAVSLASGSPERLRDLRTRRDTRRPQFILMERRPATSGRSTTSPLMAHSSRWRSHDW